MPGRLRLAGKARDEIDIDVVDAMRAQQGDVAPDDFGVVLAARARQFGFDKRLYAEADTIDPGAAPGLDPFNGEGSWSGLECGLAPGSCGECFGEFFDCLRFHSARCTAANVKRLRRPGKWVRGNLFQQCIYVTGFEFWRGKTPDAKLQ